MSAYVCVQHAGGDGDNTSSAMKDPERELKIECRLQGTAPSFFIFGREVSRTSVGMTPATVFFFLFGAVPDVCTVMRSGHVRQVDVRMIDRRTSAGQLAR